jgi:hypothetical protein
VVRVRENYHSGLLIGNDSKMNGRLNSGTADRKTLRSVDFRACGSVRAQAPADTTSFERPSGVLLVKFLRLSVFALHQLVHNLSQTLHHGGESGALELRVNRR